MNLSFNVVCLNNVFYIVKINIVFYLNLKKKNSRKRNILVLFLYFID